MTVHFRPSSYIYTSILQNPKPQNHSLVRFGLLASLTSKNKDEYEKHPGMHKLFPYATSLNRDYAVNDFIGFLLHKDRKPTAVHDLGCSVGSSTDSIGISAQHYLPQAIWKDPKQLYLFGIEAKKAIFDLFCATGFRVHCTGEKDAQNRQETPAAKGK